MDADNPGIDIIHRGKYKSLTDQQRRWLKRRQAIEPAIGHTKADHRMQHKHKVRQCLARKTALDALAQPCTGRGLSRPRPGGKREFHTHFLRLAEQPGRPLAPRGFKRRQPRRRCEREVHRGALCFALDTRDGLARGVEVDRQRLFADTASLASNARFDSAMCGAGGVAM